MGRIKPQDEYTPSFAMDIDPRPTSWNTLCPSFMDARRTKLLQDESSSHVIGSPPPASSPKVLWNENFPMEVPKNNQRDSSNPASKESSMDTTDLASRVKDIRLQPPQPMIICENVDDVNVDVSDSSPGSSVSLGVPPIDLTNEKKRPPY